MKKNINNIISFRLDDNLVLCNKEKKLLLNDVIIDSDVDSQNYKLIRDTLFYIKNETTFIRNIKGTCRV